MLKYGDISAINNGNSKSLVPRNLTYRQKELFKTTVSDSQILATIQSSTFDIPNVGNISSENAVFNTTNVSILNVDLIKKKTESENQITVNDKVLITDLNETKPIPSFSYLFTNNGSLKADSLDVQIQKMEIQDNVIYLNSTFITKEMRLNIERRNYDSMISGFIFPQINDEVDQSTISGFKNFASLIIMPANYYINKDNVEKKISFKKYVDSNGINIFPNDNNKPSLRLIRTNYPFNNQSTFTDKLDFVKDENIEDLNLTNNLLNLEVNNIAMKDGNFVLLTRNTFKPGGNNTEVNNDASFIFYASDLSGTKQLFKIGTSGVNVFGPLVIDENIIINRNGIRFGQYENEISINNYDDYNKKYIIFNKLKYKTSIVTALDLSNNGLIFFDDSKKIIFNNGSVNVMSINSSTIDSSANLNLLNSNPSITFNTGSKLLFNNGSVNVMSINSSTVDLLPNLNLLYNPPREIKPPGAINIMICLTFSP